MPSRSHRLGPQPLVRPRDGRVLAGVCVGLARPRGLSVPALRLAFLAATLVAGLGAIVYTACWLIVPDEDAAGEAGPRGVVVLARVGGATLGLASLAALAATGAVFGWNWATVAVAAAILLAGLAAGPRVRPAWALLPVAALVLGALAVHATPLRLAPVADASVLAPATAAELPSSGVVNGLGTVFVDLRRTRLPASGIVPLRIEAGVRRTLVALPHDRCVHVDLRYAVDALATGLLTRLAGRQTYLNEFGGGPSTVSLFGQAMASGSGAGRVDPERAGRGPTLRLDFSSQGGALYVRDYPDAMDPASEVDWPGYRVIPEPRPPVVGLSKRSARYRLARWRERRRAQERSRRRVDRLLPGPCATGARATR